MNNVSDDRLIGPGQVGHTGSTKKVNAMEELNFTFIYTQ